MKYQLISQDEYGTTSIISTFANTELALDKASKLVTSHNFENALTSSEQLKNIEAFLVEIGDNTLVYSSNKPDNKHKAIKVASQEVVPVDPATAVRVYIGSRFAKVAGKMNETRHYLVDGKNRPVSTLNHELLKGKTIYFVRQIA